MEGWLSQVDLISNSEFISLFISYVVLNVECNPSATEPFVTGVSVNGQEYVSAICTLVTILKIDA